MVCGRGDLIVALSTVVRAVQDVDGVGLGVAVAVVVRVVLDVDGVGLGVAVAVPMAGNGVMGLAAAAVAMVFEFTTPRVGSTAVSGAAVVVSVAIDAGSGVMIAAGSGAVVLGVSSEPVSRGVGGVFMCERNCVCVCECG